MGMTTFTLHKQHTDEIEAAKSSLFYILSKPKKYYLGFF